MNLYLFIDPRDEDLSDSQIWNDGLYFAAVWETTEISALSFAKDFYNSYNPGWTIRQVEDPTKLSTNEDDSRWNNEWDY